MLMPRKLIGTHIKIESDRVALYQLDPISAASYYKNMFEVGGINTNEIRLEENRPPVEGGDVAFVTVNVAPITSDKIYGRKPEKKEDEDANSTEK